MTAGLLTGAKIAPATAYILLGAGPILWTISTTTLRQSIAAPDMLGRVSAMLVTTTAGARPIGAGAGALIAVTLGVRWALLACLLGMSVQLLVVLLSPVARLKEYPDVSTGFAPTARWSRA